MRRTLIISAILAAIAGVVALVLFLPRGDPSSSASIDALGGSAMGSTWTVRLGQPVDPVTAGRLTGEIQTILQRIDDEMSTWKASSDLSRFNSQHTTDWIQVPAELAAIVDESRRVSEQTIGAFDITVAPLVNLWGFGGRPPAARVRRVPDDAAIAAAKAHVGYRLLEVRLQPPALRKLDPELAIDLSAIAQGYASDQVAAYLERANILDYLVDCGEIRARGNSPRGTPWRVGIQTPAPDTLRTLSGVELRNLSLATSGDYKNFFEQGGQRYSHEIDPRTGRPITHNLASVTVLHSSAAYADATATALIVLGPDAGFATAERLGLSAMFVIRGEGRYETKLTTAFPKLLRRKGADDADGGRATTGATTLPTAPSNGS